MTPTASGPDTSATSGEPTQILSGVRILEIGHFVAAPFCARLLADLGADVIKIEPPSGDPVRQWGEMKAGKSLWWSMHGRNKRCITLNLKSPRARDLVLQLAAKSDAVVENFRPGQLARLGLGPEALRAARPDLVIAHISGFGQTGPDRDRAAFGVIGEAVGGLRHLTNHPPGAYDLPPVRVGVSIGDSIAGLYAALGVMAALWRRDARTGDGIGRSIDVALTESVFSLMEGMLPEYGALGKVKAPTGGAIATAAPSNAYPTRDGEWVLIAANSEPLFANLARLMEMPGLLVDPAYAGNAARVRHSQELDALIGAWTRGFDAEALIAALSRADIPNSKVYTAADCAADPQYRDRGMVREVNDPLLGISVLQAGIVPRIGDTAGAIRWPGPDIGQHNEEVFGGLLGLQPSDVAQLRTEGVL
jgi:crotonobetainyl-CoA:carnitine CoA-transferase CaiB-like acyl-CoA transferase